MHCKGVYIATILLALVAVSASRPKHGSGGHCNCHGPKCPCDPHCICQEIYDPVCGVDGQTYGNSCEANCDGVKVACEQECPCPSKCEDHCPKIYHPVCGTNGQTYGNRCLAGCAHVKVKCDQKCPCPKCEDHCPKIYKPVCGKDGNQYDNECLAICAGTSVDCAGHCPCKSTCVKEGGSCWNLNSVGNIHIPKDCCRGLECCPKHSIGKHNSVSGICQYKCDSYKG